MKTSKILLSVAFLLLGVVATVQGQPLLKTHVETGDVEGVLEGTDLAMYKAIPYAAPPVGDPADRHALRCSAQLVSAGLVYPDHEYRRLGGGRVCDAAYRSAAGYDLDPGHGRQYDGL